MEWRSFTLASCGPLTQACGSKGGKSMATRIRWLGSALGACVIAAVNIAPSVRAEKTATPIKHVVVIFQENVSFDHYFGTYPVADNPAGEPQFRAAPDTPSVNGLTGRALSANTKNVNHFPPQHRPAATRDPNH